MAVLQTSGNRDFNQSAVDLIVAAYRIINVVGEAEVPSGYQLQQGLDALNAMVTGWQAAGIHVWCEEEAILIPQVGQALYRIGPTSTDHACLWDELVWASMASAGTVGATSVTLRSASGITDGYNIGFQLSDDSFWWTTVASVSGLTVALDDAIPSPGIAGGTTVFAYYRPLVRPLRVYGGRRLIISNKIENPMVPLARLDYQAQPNKYTLGWFNQYFFDPQTGQGVYQGAVAQLSLWPAPQDNQSAFRFTAQRPIQNFSEQTNIPDFPREWLAALKWNLAVELGPAYGVPPEALQVVIQQATRWYQLAAAWDREPESVLFGAAMRSGFRTG